MFFRALPDINVKNDKLRSNCCWFKHFKQEVKRMNSRGPLVDSFVAAVRRRLNRHLLFSTLLWSAGVGAAVMLAIGVVYVVPGYAVPPFWYAVVGGLAVLSALVVWAVRRVNAERAAGFADEFFGLKDSVLCCRHFAESGKSGGFYDLQAAQTEDRVGRLQPQAIKYRLPRRLFAVSLLLLVVAVLLGFKSPSEAVQRRLALQQRTLDETQQINRQLEELVERLRDETEGAEEEELIEPDKLRQWVQELSETTDRKEALRQYARLEQKLAEASARLEQKRDEQLLDRAAKELGQDRATEQLAETLKQKKYEEAVEELRKLSPEPKEGLSKQRKQFARMQAAARRMSSAVQALRRDREQDKRRLERLVRHRDSQGLTSGGGDSGADSGELEDLIEDLEESVEDWDEALEEAELQDASQGEIEEITLQECELCRGGVEDDLEKLGKKLARLALKRKAQRKLNALRSACSQCQSGLCNNPAATPGGPKAGWGSSDEKRQEQDPLIDNGQYTQLKGTKGEGPSLTTVEAAAEGDGVSTRKAVQRGRSFRQQVESFVQREDVPEGVRSGVKEYFKNIHQADQADQSDAASAPSADAGPAAR